MRRPPAVRTDCAEIAPKSRRNRAFIGAKQLDAMLRFLPVLEQPGAVLGGWQTPEGHMPYYALSRDASRFARALYAQKTVFAFDWPSWDEQVEKLMADPEAVAAADLLAWRKLRTAHARADRFVEGHLGSVLELGHITAILKRLSQIRNIMG